MSLAQVSTTTNVSCLSDIPDYGFMKSFAFDNFDSKMAATISKGLSSATAEWALEMLRRVGKPEEDVFLSPVSIAVALGMAYAGAAGKTAEQFNQTLFKGLTEEQVHEGFASFVADLNTPRGGYKLHTANKLYGQQGLPLLDEFVATLKKNYQSELKSVDFKTNANGVAAEISRWVEEVTAQRIKDLIAPGVLDSSTRLVLVNAIYFKGDWRRQFKKSDTSEETFYSSANSEKKVQMMHQVEKFAYHETDQVQVLGMPYKDKDLVMFVLLPKEKFGLGAFEKQLDGRKFLQLITAARVENVRVTMPRFKLTNQFQLGDTLAAMGMPDAFSDDDADFSRMTGKRDLKISKVIHKAFVEVNEEGSEAAAATAVVMATEGFVREPEPKIFTADHPFLFAIYSRKHAQLYFLGHTSDPKEN